MYSNPPPHCKSSPSLIIIPTELSYRKYKKKDPIRKFIFKQTKEAICLLLTWLLYLLFDHEDGVSKSLRN
jgi:hypothetical protein